MEPYESLNWMWDDIAGKDADLAAMKSLSAKHAKMFFALGAVAYRVVQHQKMVALVSVDEAEDVLNEMNAEATSMLLEAKKAFAEHKLPSEEGLSGT